MLSDSAVIVQKSLILSAQSQIDRLVRPRASFSASV